MIFGTIACVTAIMCIYRVDYWLGRHLMDMMQCTLCRIVCCVKRFIEEEVSILENMSDVPITLPMIALEVILLILTKMLLKKYKQLRIGGRIDELIKESKATLKESNDYLDRWQLKRAPLKTHVLNDVTNKKLEVPILQMAFIDSASTSKHRLSEQGDQGDQGDTGDTIYIENGSLSISSIISNDSDLITDSILDEKSIPDKFKNKFYLWDGTEEQSITAN